MKSCEIYEQRAVLDEDLQWSHPVYFVEGELNRQTELLLGEYSVSMGDAREYVFSTLVEQFNGRNIIDDEEPSNGEEGRIY